MPSLSTLKVHRRCHVHEKMSFSVSPGIHFGVLGGFILVLYKLLNCQSEREILKRLGWCSMLSAMKWPLSASPDGIFLQDCSSAGLLFNVSFGFTMVPLPILWWVSPLPRPRAISRLMQSLVFILKDSLRVLLVRTCVCASVQRGLSAHFTYMQEAESHKPKN